MRFQFDAKLWATLWVTAENEQEARRKLISALAPFAVELDVADGVTLHGMSIEDDGEDSELMDEGEG